MRRLSLRRVCLTLTVCNTAAMLAGPNLDSTLRRFAPSLAADQWYLGLLPTNSWEFMAYVALFMLLWISILACTLALVIPRRHQHALPITARGRVWLSALNLVIMGYMTLTPHLAK